MLYTRLALFAVCISCMPALLPLVARQRLGLGPAAFGVLFGALGLGAVLMAGLLPRLRTRAGPDLVAAIGAGGYAAAFAITALTTNPPVVLAAMVVAGAGQISVLTTVTTTVQTDLPNWVRGRGLAVFWLVLQGSLAGGALVWGSVASTWRLQTALFAAAAATVATALAVAPLRLAARADVDTRLGDYWLPLTPMITLANTGPSWSPSTGESDQTTFPASPQ